MTPTTRKRVLRPAVFDAIKRGAEKHGGVGTGTMYRGPDCPVCGIGLAHSEGAVPIVPPIEGGGNWESIDDLLYENPVAKLVGFYFSDSDTAVDAVIGTIHGPDERAPFEEWAKKLGIVRGIELPAKVYDRLKESAEKYGGIGADTFEATSYSADEGGITVPYCVAGHAALIDSDGTYPDAGMPTIQALQHAFNLKQYYNVFDINDAAVYAINKRKGGDEETARVSFDEWADELNVLRASA